MSIMTRYSVQQRDRTFVKSYEFLFFARNMGKNIGENLSITTVRNFLIKLNKLLQMHLRLLQKEQFKKKKKKKSRNN